MLSGFVIVFSDPLREVGGGSVAGLEGVVTVTPVTLVFSAELSVPVCAALTRVVEIDANCWAERLEEEELVEEELDGGSAPISKDTAMPAAARFLLRPEFAGTTLTTRI